MIQLLFLSLFLIFFSGLVLYRYTGRKRLLKFDLVQFIYAFIIAPFVFVWMKTFVFYLVQSEINTISQTSAFIVDTVISLLGLFVYSFVIVHFITKNFEIKRYRDPLYDIFQLSEVIHLWISHLGFYFGLLLLATSLSILNIIFPLEFELSKIWFYFLIFVGSNIGVVLFLAVWLSNFTKSKFMKINKIIFAFHLFVHLSLYFLSEVDFTTKYIVYWFFLSTFLSTNLCSIFFERSKKIAKIFDSWHHKYLEGWSGIQKQFNNPR